MKIADLQRMEDDMDRYGVSSLDPDKLRDVFELAAWALELTRAVPSTAAHLAAACQTIEALANWIEQLRVIKVDT